MLKYWRVWILVIVLLFSLFAIGLKAYPYGRTGVVVAYVSEDSPVDFLKSGDQITSINNKEVINLDDWNRLTKNLEGIVSIKVNGEEHEFTLNDSLGVNVVSLDRVNLDLGLDLKGGSRILLKIKENVSEELFDQTIETLRTRSNLFGLTEIKIKPIFGREKLIQIEASGIGSNVINNFLTKIGDFEAKISKPVSIKNNAGVIVLGENNYPFSTKNQFIQINNKIIGINETFVLENITLELLTLTENQAVFLGSAYQGDDIELIYSDPQRTGIQQEQNGFSFFFTVLVSKKGAEKFAKITSGIPTSLSISTGAEYLEGSEIFLYLDNELITNLRIAASLGGRPYTTPQMTGFRETREEALAESFQLQTILRSGALPTQLEIVSTDIISPTLGSNFLSSIVVIAGLAGLVVFLIVFFKYRKIKIALPLVIVALTEVIIILGIASINDSIFWTLAFLFNVILLTFSWLKKHEVDMFAWVGALSIPILGAMMSWTIDLPAIAGILAVIGTGVDHQIIIADETLRGTRERIKTLKEKLRSAFFIIFGAASTTIFTMLPLIFLVAEFVRGFALTTIIGVWVGITITRPAYARIIEIFLGREETVQDEL